MASTTHASGPRTRFLPRILCLHGAGVTAEIFQLQMRAVSAKLENEFRLVYVDGPFEGDMHPDLYPVYSGMGPYRNWSPWKSQHETTPAHQTINMIERSLMDTMDADDGTGEWVGILGFSQGAKIAFSVLYENQLRRRRCDRNQVMKPFAGVDFKFGIILAGRAPPYALSDVTCYDPRFSTPGASPVTNHVFVDGASDRAPIEKLMTPTLHVHGLQDGGLDLHRQLHRMWVAPYTDHLVEWNGAHRIAFKSWDVKPVIEGTMKIAKKSRAI